MLKLFRYLKPYFWLCLVLLVATGAQVYTTLQLPSLMAHIINDGIVPGNTEYIWRTGGLMILLAIVSAGCSFLANYLAAKIGANFVRDIRADIFKKIMSLNTSDLEMYSTASLINRTTNDTNQVQQTIVMMLSLMLHAPLFCIISLVMAIQTAPDMSWIIALGIVLILCSTILIMSLVIPKFKIFQKLLDKITLITRENLTGLKVIRAFDNEDLEKRKFSKTNNELTKLLIFIDKILELQNPLINVIFNGLTLLCTYVGITLLTKDFAYLGNMSAFAQYVTFVMISFMMMFA